MDMIVLIFSPGFMLIVRLVPVRANGRFPAKCQEFKVELSAVDTESDRVHCSSVSAGDPTNGHFPGHVPAIRADEDYPWTFSSLHFLWALFRPLKKAGRGRVKEDKPLPLGEGPYFESARGLLGGTWGLKAGWSSLRIGSAVGFDLSSAEGHDMELIRLEDRQEDFLHVFPF